MSIFFRSTIFSIQQKSDLSLRTLLEPSVSISTPTYVSNALSSAYPPNVPVTIYSPDLPLATETSHNSPDAHLPSISTSLTTPQQTEPAIPTMLLQPVENSALVSDVAAHQLPVQMTKNYTPRLNIAEIINAAADAISESIIREYISRSFTGYFMYLLWCIISIYLIFCSCIYTEN